MRLTHPTALLDRVLENLSSRSVDVDEPRTFKDELLDDLRETGMSDFPYVDGMARGHGYQSRRERRAAILELLTELFDGGVIEIGDAVGVSTGPGLLDGFTDFLPWEGGRAAVLARLRYVLSTRTDAPKFCGFWIAPTKGFRQASAAPPPADPNPN